MFLLQPTTTKHTPKKQHTLANANSKKKEKYKKNEEIDSKKLKSINNKKNLKNKNLKKEVNRKSLKNLSK